MKDFEEYKRKMAQHQQSWTDALPDGWKAHYRVDRGIWEAGCAHGVGHPHPKGRYSGHDSVHGCDGCCFKLPPYTTWAVSDV